MGTLYVGLVGMGPLQLWNLLGDTYPVGIYIQQLATSKVQL